MIELAFQLAIYCFLAFFQGLVGVLYPVPRQLYWAQRIATALFLLSVMLLVSLIVVVNRSTPFPIFLSLLAAWIVFTIAAGFVGAFIQSEV